jgi:putative SOS response-associated peptidase YedK
MCGRYIILTAGMTDDVKAIVREAQLRVEATGSGLQVKTGEIFPTDIAPILVFPHESPKPEIRPMVWGYPNFGPRKGVLFNTRIEQASQRPMWRESFAQRRCAVLASGFYEWRHDGSRNREKLLFTCPDMPLLYFAGIYQHFQTPSSTDSPSTAQAVSALHDRFSILTTSANASVSDVHDRMPVILCREDLKEWFSGDPSAFAVPSSIELQRQSA